MDEEIGVHIDLLNIEESQFEGSKYVLTSPRSLEACSRLNVKPIELLYKPLSEYQEELLPQDIPLRTIYSLYDEGEVIRQEKLKLCREERNRIIKSDNLKSQGDSSKDLTIKSPTKGSHVSKGNPPRRKGKISSTTAAGFRSIGRLATAPRSSDKESVKLHRELVSKKDRNSARPKSVLKTRPSSGRRRKAQRCSTSVTFGSKVNVRTNSVPNMTIKLPARDEKILQLMQQRREEEKNTREMTKHVNLLWDDERKREEALKTIAENKRRRLIAEENRILDEKRVKELDMRRDLEEEALELKKLSIEESQYKADTRLRDTLKMQELQLAEKISKNLAKKDNQERNLQANEKDAEIAKQLILARKRADLTSASERKDMIVHHEALKRFYDNRQERQLYERRQQTVREKERENSQVLKSSIDGRLDRAESNLSHVLEARNEMLERKRREDELKLKRARSAHRKMEAEMDAWRHGILFHKKMLEDKAADVVNKSIELKSWKVKKDRTKRQLGQKKNIAKIHKEVEQWRVELEDSVKNKDKRVEDLLEEKERSVAQTRAMAQLSQTLRDDLKEKYQSDTFDKKVLEAQLYSNLNNISRPRTPYLKNKSSVKIY